MTWDIFTVIHLHEFCVHHPMRRGLGEHRRGWGVAESSTCIRNVSSIKFRTRGPPTVLVSRRKLTIIIWKTKLRRSPWRVVKMLRWAIFRMPPLWSSSRSLIWMFHICCPGHWKKIDGFLQVDLAHSLRENVKIFCKTKSTSVKVICKQRFQYGGPKYNNLPPNLSFSDFSKAKTNPWILFSSSLIWRISE